VALGSAGTVSAADESPPVTVVFRSTIAALLAPRRAFPITVVVLPLLFLQCNYSDDPLALPLAVLLCATFLLCAPTLWRLFFPLKGQQGSALLRALVYGGIGVSWVV